MTLQSSGTIKISEIRAEIGTPSSNSNVSLRALSSSAGKSTPDAMSEFYSYTHATLTSYSSSAGQGSVFGVCDTSLLQTYYHDGSGSLPVTGDVCYSDSAGNNYLSAYFYKISSSSYIKIVSSTGDVALVGSCGEL